jgi:xylulose-5-phosphate/fructose-6-phosphate phosphoketolase
VAVTRQAPGVASSDESLWERIDAYWRAMNYLTVGQIFLRENPLLLEPLRPEHIKPRLLGHWGTSPGLSLIYVHLNRLIKERDANVIYLTGPGHGGPSLVAGAYLENTYTEVYPEVTQDTAGMRRLFRQFSAPGGVPSHVSVPTPGSIHEGGELGYVLMHAFGAVFDNPDLIAVAVIGDGEAETAPLAGSWQGVRFLNPARDGAVLPILHINGYKIAGPTIMGRDSDEDIESLLRGHGYEVHFVSGDDPAEVHPAFWEALETCYDRIRAIQDDARTNGFSGRPAWPAIALRTPKGWTGPKEVGGVPVEGTFRSHQVPFADVIDNPEHLALLETWLRSYRPEELFDRSGRLIPELAALAPQGDRRMSANPHANGGSVMVELDLPPIEDYAIPVAKPARERHESTRKLGEWMRDIFKRNAEQANFRLFCPDETNSNRLGAVFQATDRCFVGRTIDTDDHVSPDGRVMEVLSEHNCQGWLEGYLLTGRHGLFATYEAFAMVSASMTVQHAKWLEEGIKLDWREPIPSLNILLTSTCWRNDHNGFSHQGPGLIETVMSKKGAVSRIYLPPDANSLLAVADECFRSRNCVNLIVIDKQPQLQYLTIEEAKEQTQRGASIWKWASTDEGYEPDVVLAAAGDVATQEVVSGAWLGHKYAPELRVRVVNVIDLMCLYPRSVHPHGLSEEEFVEIFTEDKPVIFAFHGYNRSIYSLLHGRTNAHRFHVRGFDEEGTTTTPFDMVVRNGMSRFHLGVEGLRRSRRRLRNSEDLVAQGEAMLERHESYIREHLVDMPEVQDWVWAEL